MKSHQIKDYMSKMPIVTINSHQSLRYALETMREYNIRHLPVLEQGSVVGVLSQRDIRFVESFENLTLEELFVSDAYSDDLVEFEPSADIRDVCKKNGRRENRLCYHTNQ